VAGLAYDVLVSLTSLIAAGWLFLVLRKIRLGRQIPRLPDHDAPPLKSPSVSVVIPARNEEQNISPTLRSIMAQDYPDFDIVVVDDSSEDRTAEVAREFAAQSAKVSVLSLPPVPSGWTGKNWACVTGANQTHGAWLLFLDADAMLAPQTIRRAVAYALQERLDLLSLKPLIICRGFWLKATTPLFLNLMALLIPIGKVNDPRTRTAYFYGSFILARRDAYRQIGGHEHIRTELVEDRALAGAAKAAQLRIRLVEGGHVFAASWNTSFATLWAALQRIVYRSAGRNPRGGTLFSLFLVFLLVFPFAAVIAALVAGVFTAGALGWLLLGLSGFASGMAIATQYQECRYLRLAPTYAFTAPIGACLFIAAIVTAAWRAQRGLGITWRGRMYDPLARARQSQAEVSAAGS
jgi:cellulose synthase/poly-beta-1,6-N-acetylglucosamine synthase-like glycosyltransferase